MVRVWFDVVGKDGSVFPAGVEFKHNCQFGWAGRDQQEVARHAAELAELGIRGPQSIPEHFILSPNLITHDEEITCVGEGTCGEVEFFFFLYGGDILVGIGSDHTDRFLETVDMTKSKALCQKPMSKQVWRYSEIKDHWDDIKLTAWQVNEKGETVLYQSGTCGDLMSIESLLKEAYTLYDKLDDVIMWSGTISTLHSFVFGSRFFGELDDTKLGRKLKFGYHVKVTEADKQ